MYKLPVNIEKFSYANIENLSEKSVVIRACLNADVDDSGKVTDATRIKEAAKGIKYFAENAKQVYILGHLGRPEKYSKELSFWNVHEVLQEELRMDVQFVPFGSDAKIDGKIILRDNIRFFEDEENKNLDKRMAFAKELANLGDVFVNDAFADYRESASTYDIAKAIPSFIGPKFLEEIEALSTFSSPKRPFIAVLGGAKLSEKLDALKALAESADKILVGGAMAYTLLKSDGIDVGTSRIESDKFEIAKEIMLNYKEKLVLPTDHIAANEFSEEEVKKSFYVDSQKIEEGKVGVDIGQETIQNFTKWINEAGSILWNGPMGVFEWFESSKGTVEVAKAIAANPQGYKLAGGGDSIAAINKFNLSGFDFISTGGGAMLAFIAYDKFPTLDVIINK